MGSKSFIAIFKEHENDPIPDGDPALQGLLILMKYHRGEKILQAADDDEIYTVGIGDLIGRGITDDDIHALAALGWRISEENLLTCLV